jgi:hypothetical protein
MLDCPPAARLSPTSVALAGRAGRERRRALVACAALALGLHAAFIGNIGGGVPGSIETGLAPMSVRTLPDELPADTLSEPAAAAEPVVKPPQSTPPSARVPRRAREPAPAGSAAVVVDSEKASADSSGPFVVSEAAASSDPSAVVSAGAATTAAAADAAASAAAEVGEAPAAVVNAAAVRPPLLAAGDEPPPVYRTQLPPSVTLHYQVRRGFLRGTGQIRWQPSGERYRLALEAQVGGLTLLTQTSEGGIDANGLAPVRFLDQRARRSAQAANFRRDDGRITFSGAPAEWPLLAGSQDRLSWMIQLAAIAAAEPERLVDGGRISMVVVGARGDASVWTFRYAGSEAIETVRATVHAVKLVREGRSAYDTSAEIWLDPERSYLPAHATLRNSSGASEYDLLLERAEAD